jgi:nitrate reductase NapE component
MTPILGEFQRINLREAWKNELHVRFLKKLLMIGYWYIVQIIELPRLLKGIYLCLRYSSKYFSFSIKEIKSAVQYAMKYSSYCINQMFLAIIRYPVLIMIVIGVFGYLSLVKCSWSSIFI